MNITVFGASGGTGTAFAEQALAGAHEVTAVVRDPARLKVAPSTTGVTRAIVRRILSNIEGRQTVNGCRQRALCRF